jgi:molecular chaperone DnaJ
VAGKDYYKILGVDKNASQDEIKKAFRKKAHKLHPDKESGDEEKFKRVNEAYQVLGDEEKRKKYDQFGSAAFGGGAGGGRGAGGAGFGGFDFSGGGGFGDLGDIFEEMFGGGGGFAGARGGARTKRGQDIKMDLDLTFEESIFGVNKEVTVNKSTSCERCAGTGAEPGTDMRTCPSCGGKGFEVRQQRTVLGTMQSKAACQNCEGEGEVPEKECETCDGYGVSKEKQTIEVTIPAGINEGDTLRVRGQGEAVKGGQTGDLYIQIHILPDKRFEREGRNVVSEIDIGFTQAALGDTVEVETLKGSVDLKIPAGTQSGTKFRLDGKGVPTKRGRGDQIVIANVKTPENLTRKQKKLMKELELTVEE